MTASGQRERALSERPEAAGSRADGSPLQSCRSRRWSARSARSTCCATTSCDSFVTSLGHRQARGPAGGDLRRRRDTLGLHADGSGNVGQLFDSHLYPIDTTAFGTESDLDGNGVVIVLLTPARQPARRPTATPPAASSWATSSGWTCCPARRIPTAARSSTASCPVPSHRCSHPQVDAIDELPPVFIHEFQHMISFNQHVLVRGGTAEDTWLNEGLSHFAEELGGERVPDAFCQPAFTNCENQFNGGNIEQCYGYLDDPESSFLIEPGNSAGTRAWGQLALRPLAGRPLLPPTQPQATELTRALVQTDQVGAANVQAVTGEDFGVAGRPVAARQLSHQPAGLHALELPAAVHHAQPARHLPDELQQRRLRQALPAHPRQTRDGSYAHTGALRGGLGAPRPDSSPPPRPR